MALGLVLGGGGVVGIAWEVGVLAGLADGLGWDPASPEVVVGTSAGSVIGTMLRSGRSIEELVVEQRSGGLRIGRTPPAAGEAAADPSAALAVFRSWAGVEHMDADTARATAALASAVATADEADMVDSFRQALPDAGWPDGDLRITGVSVSTGERVAWTADSGVDLVRAVAASCAVPGMFPPITVDGDRYLDGGLWSGSNADLLLGDGLAAAVFIGPMGVGSTGLASFSARALERERALLATAGTALELVEPGDRFRTAAMQLMDPTRRAEALEIGLAEGADAVERLRGLLG
jgi:NTE family protein